MSHSSSSKTDAQRSIEVVLGRLDLRPDSKTRPDSGAAETRSALTYGRPGATTSASRHTEWDRPATVRLRAASRHRCSTSGSTSGHGVEGCVVAATGCAEVWDLDRPVESFGARPSGNPVSSRRHSGPTLIDDVWFLRITLRAGVHPTAAEHHGSVGEIQSPGAVPESIGVYRYGAEQSKEPRGGSDSGLPSQHQTLPKSVGSFHDVQDNYTLLCT